MPLFRVERTEFHTRVYLIDAPDADTAFTLSDSDAAEEDDDKSFHSGDAVTVVISPNGTRTTFD